MTMARYRLADVPPELRARIVVDPAWGCWEWQHDTGPNSGQYGSVQWLGGYLPVYRLVYSLLKGPIPPGLVLDHVYAWGCRSKACCWPAHLEPVTAAENTRRSVYANIVNGITPSVARRLASGNPRPSDAALADAVWMLPLPCGPAPKRYQAERPARAPVERALVEDDPSYPAGMVAAMLSARLSDLERWRTNGGGPDYFRADGEFYYRSSAIREYIERLMREQNPAVA